ncbi:MAG: hypothetical protein JWM93_3606 [Frankiales bacterium]|nr:hypothetical protein [Frankiales bacterium]
MSDEHRQSMIAWAAGLVALLAVALSFAVRDMSTVVRTSAAAFVVAFALSVAAIAVLDRHDSRRQPSLDAGSASAGATVQATRRELVSHAIRQRLAGADVPTILSELYDRGATHADLIKVLERVESIARADAVRAIDEVLATAGVLTPGGPTAEPRTTAVPSTGTGHSGSLDPDLVSEAIVVWTGKGGQQPFAAGGELRLVERFGISVAADVLPTVRALRDEFSTIPRDHLHTQWQAADHAAEAFAPRHPELSIPAVEALRWCYAHDHA